MFLSVFWYIIPVCGEVSTLTYQLRLLFSATYDTCSLGLWGIMLMATFELAFLAQHHQIFSVCNPSWEFSETADLLIWGNLGERQKFDLKYHLPSGSWEHFQYHMMTGQGLSFSYKTHGFVCCAEFLSNLRNDILCVEQDIKLHLLTLRLILLDCTSVAYHHHHQLFVVGWRHSCLDINQC